MFRSWKLCGVLSVFLLASLLISAQAQDGEELGGGEVDFTGGPGGDEETYEEQVDDEEEDGSQPESVWVDEHFTEEQLKEIHKKVDANGDKKISHAELLAFSNITRQKLIERDSHDEFEELDSDSDGKISLDELLGHHEDTIEGIEMPVKSAEEQAEDDAFKALETAKFKAADANHDGFLFKDETHGIFYPEAHDGVLDLVAASNLKIKDTNGDGELDPEELWRNEDDDDEPDKKHAEEALAVQAADFEKLDLDANGKISLAEYKQFESGHFHMSDAMKHLIETADQDGDGLLTATELSRAKELLANHPAVPHLLEWINHHEL